MISQVLQVVDKDCACKQFCLQQFHFLPFPNNIASSLILTACRPKLRNSVAWRKRQKGKSRRWPPPYWIRRFKGNYEECLGESRDGGPSHPKVRHPRQSPSPSLSSYQGRGDYRDVIRSRSLNKVFWCIFIGIISHQLVVHLINKEGLSRSFIVAPNFTER